LNKRNYAVSTEKVVEAAARHDGIVYIRTTRSKTPIIYDVNETFPIGGCKVLRRSDSDAATVIGAGITVHEALKAYEKLSKEDIAVRIIDLYSVKPVDSVTINQAAVATGRLITVEDHYAEGGIADAVRSVLIENPVPIYSLAVRKKPKSGKPEQLMDFEEIGKDAIVEKVKQIIS